MLIKIQKEQCKDNLYKSSCSNQTILILIKTFYIFIIPNLAMQDVGEHMHVKK